MSTGLNCLYFESEKGEWFYALESDFGLKNSFDWTEDADIVGPFPTFQAAHEYLHANNANPGSYFKCSYAGQNAPQRQQYANLRAKAREPKGSGMRIPAIGYFPTILKTR